MSTQKFQPRIITGNQLHFSEELFVPMKTGKEVDIILSTQGGLMKATNLMLVGGPGSGKSTIALDWLANLTMMGHKCLFLSAEMDEVAYYKYCTRLPLIKKVPVLFLREYGDNLKEVIEQVFEQGWDVIGVDSMAEIIAAIKEYYKVSEGAAEKWFLDLQEYHKNGRGKSKKFTSFINIQQVAKNGVFVGSNRLKHMTDAMCHVSKGESMSNDQRTLHFSKNRDCDKDWKIYFAINKDAVYYAYENIDDLRES